jgi:putative tryptophan/tyrosine transport system substrate-binding protein
MRKRIFVWLLVTVLQTTAPTAEAQQPKIHRIGFLSTPSASVISARIEAFRQGLRELGYVEGKNIVVEYRNAQGKVDGLAALAAELVRLQVEAIVTSGPQPVRPMREATATIPIVFAFDDDPVGSGFVASLARPAGNITGLSTQGAELIGKQLELLKEINPKLSRVAVLGSSTRPGTAQAFMEAQLAAPTLSVQLQYIEVADPKDIEIAFQSATQKHADAVVILGSPLLNSHRTQIVELATKRRLPTTYSRPEYVEDGGLMTYGANINDLFRRAATYVDKILKGAKPADLPVEQPKKFEFIINLKAAKQIGLNIPPNVLARADRVIR